MEIYVANSGKESGPFTAEQVASMHGAGLVNATDSVWHADLPEWVPVHQFLNIRPPVPAEAVIPGNADLENRLQDQRESGPIRKRTMSQVMVWMVVSLGFYGIYLIAAYSPEVAKITGRRKLEFHVVLLLSILTCGLFGMIYHCVLAYKIWNHSINIELIGRDPKLAHKVWYWNLVVFVLFISSAGMALPVSIFGSAWSVWLLQQELNLYADRERRSGTLS